MAARVDKLVAKAHKLESKGKLDKALDVYRQVAELSPHDPDHWIALGGVAETLGENAEAAEALFRAADMMFRGGLYAEALGLARRVQALDPGHGGARLFVRKLEARVAPREEVSSKELPKEPPKEKESAPTAKRRHTSLTDMLTLMASEDGAAAQPPDAVPRARRYSKPITMPPLPEEAITPEVLSLAEWIPFEKGTQGSDISLDDDEDAGRKKVRAATSSAAGSALSELDKELVDRLYDAGSFLQMKPGQVVCEQGQRQTSLYIVTRGQVEVTRRARPEDEPARLAVLRAGAFFGEMALLTSMARTATVRAVTDAMVIEVPRKEVRGLIEADPKVLRLLMRFFRARLVGTLLEVSPLFGGFTREEKRQLVTRFRLREISANQQVIAEGDPVEGLFVVLAGQLDVERGGNIVAELGTGDVMGEISLLDDSGATASVWTRTRSWVLLITRQEFRALIRSHQGVREHLIHVASARREGLDGSRLQPV